MKRIINLFKHTKKTNAPENDSAFEFEDDSFPDEVEPCISDEKSNVQHSEDRIKESINKKINEWWEPLEELIDDFERTFRYLETEKAEAAKQGENVPYIKTVEDRLTGAYYFLHSIEERLLIATGGYDKYFSQMTTDKIDLQLEIGQCELIIKALKYYEQNEPELQKLFSENFDFFDSRRAFIWEIKNSIQVKLCESQSRK